MQFFLDPLTPWPTLRYFLSPHSLACVTMTEKQTFEGSYWKGIKVFIMRTMEIKSLSQQIGIFLQLPIPDQIAESASVCTQGNTGLFETRDLPSIALVITFFMHGDFSAKLHQIALLFILLHSQQPAFFWFYKSQKYKMMCEAVNECQ